VIEFLSGILALAALTGSAYQLISAWAVHRFRRSCAEAGSHRPPVTILKPLRGTDRDLYANLRSFCEQDYPAYEVVFGVRDQGDSTIPTVRRLMRDLGARDHSLVVDSRVHGTNPKVSNLINMLPRARHEILVIADSDMRVGPDYLAAVAPPLLDPRIGIVTCLYAGRPAADLWSRLGAMFINSQFLPGALFAHWIRYNEGCFGATIAMRKDVLERVGGFVRFRDQLADDYALGTAVREHGLAVALSPYVVDAVVEEPSFRELFRHEVRWGRTIRSVAPVGYAASAVTHCLPLAFIALLLGGATLPYTGVLAIAGLSRVILVGAVRNRFGASAGEFTLLPLRDALSFLVLVASFCGRKVRWRGDDFHVDADGQLLARS